MLEGVIVFVFLGEVTVHLLHTKNKMLYLRKNWFYILTILPMVGILRLFAVGNSAKFIRILHLVAHSKVFNIEASGVKFLSLLTPGTLMMAKRAGSMAYHLKRTDFSQVPRAMNVLYINRFTSPHVDKNVQRGFYEGLKYYLEHKKRHKVVFRDKGWFDMFKTEQGLNHKGEDIDVMDYISALSAGTHKNWNVVLTDQELYHQGVETFGSVKLAGNCGYCVATAGGLDSNHAYEQICDADFFRYRGFLVGYSTVASALDPCYTYNVDCVHRPMTWNNLDIHAFSLSLHKRVQVCDLHREPSH